MSQHSVTWVHVKTGRSRFCRVLSASLTVSRKLALAGFTVCWGRVAMLGQYMPRTRHWEFRYKSVCRVNTRVLFLPSSSIPWYLPILCPHMKLFFMLGLIRDLVIRGDAGAGSLGLGPGKGGSFCTTPFSEGRTGWGGRIEKDPEV